MARTNIDISGIVKELFERNNVQVHSLDVLDPGLRALFARREKKALLLFRDAVLQTFFSEDGNRRLLLPLETLPVSGKPGERVLVILPAEDGNKRYVLQTFIKNVFIDRVELQIMDPRYHRRIRPAAAYPVLFRPVPQSLLLELQTGKLHLVREATGTAEERCDGKKGKAEPDCPRQCRITDLLADEEEKIATAHQSLLQEPSFPGTLVDFSCGGMSLATEKLAEVKLPDGLLYCQLTLAGQGPDSDAGPEISVFATIRAIRATADGHLLHLMFPGRLPEELLSCLE